MIRGTLRLLKSPVVRAGEGIAATLRTEAPRNVFWSVYYPPNFGDLVGPYLYQEMTGEPAIFQVPDGLSRTSVYMTAGSIMGLAQGNCIVWGSGILSRDANFPAPWRTLAVRGPHTRQRFLDLGYECPAVYGDPAILLPHVYAPSNPTRSHRLGIIPHYVDYAAVASWFAGDPRIRVIDVTHPVDQVVDQILSCERTLSSSLHGVIVSHAYGVPCAWVHFSERVAGDGVKFHDYFASGGVDKVKATVVTEATSSFENLSSIVDGAPFPHLQPLLAPLLEACPFPRVSAASRI